MESTDVVMIYMEQVKDKDFAEYLEEIKKLYSLDAYEVKSEENISYMAFNGEGNAVYLTYVTEGEELSISISKTDK